MTYHVRSLSLNSKGHIFIASDAYAFRSTDDGGHWTTIFVGYGINSVAIDSIDQIFAATSGGGVFLSTDNGDSWSRAGLSGQFEVYFVYSVVPGRLLAVTAIGMQLSTDNGKNWTHTNITNPTGYSFAKDGRGVIFAALKDSGVYRSLDSGATWKQVNKGLKTLDVRSIAITPNEVLIAGTFGGGIYYSLNGGEEWLENNADIESLFINSIFVESDSVFFAATMSGIFCSSNNGASWHQIKLGITYSSAEVYSVNVSLHGNTIAGGTGGIYSSSNKGLSWIQVGIPSTLVLTTTSGKNGDLFAGTAYQGVFRSLDSGRTWSQTGLKDSTIHSMAIDTEGKIYAGSSTLMQSTDNGENWSPLDIRRATIYGMTLTKKGNIIIATDSSGLHRSTNGGATWNVVNFLWHVSYAVGTSTNGDIYAEVEDYSGRNKSVYRSTDEGSTWTICGLSNESVRCFAFNSLRHIFAGTDSNGVNRSTDNGSSWDRVNSGLTSQTIHSLAIDENGFLYAGTSAGVFHSIEPTTDVLRFTPNSPNSFSLYQNYPNPFNPVTNFRFTVPEAHQLNESSLRSSAEIADLGFVSLKIYNILGREVATLVNEEKLAGSYSVRWDATDFSSGVYFYRLMAGGFSETKKLSFIK